AYYTQPIGEFWKEVRALTAHHYSLEKTQVVTNRTVVWDTPLRSFRAFSQSEYPVLNQLDDYHIFQGLIAHLDLRKIEYKDEIRKALKERDLDYLDRKSTRLNSS